MLSLSICDTSKVSSGQYWRLSEMTKVYSLDLPVLFQVAADFSLRGLKSGRSITSSKTIFIKNLDFQLYNIFDHHSLFNKIRRRFLHDSADTWELLPLDPGSSDIHGTDLSAAGDYLYFWQKLWQNIFRIG